MGQGGAGAAHRGKGAAVAQDCRDGLGVALPPMPEVEAAAAKIQSAFKFRMKGKKN